MDTSASAADSDVQMLAVELANLPPVSTLEPEQRARLIERFRDTAVAFIGPAPEVVIAYERGRSAEQVIAELETMQTEIFKLLPALLPNARLAVSTLTPIPSEPRRPLAFQARFSLEGRRLRTELVGVRTDSLGLAMLDDLLRRPRRIPLWACDQCGAVIPQRARGRPARFCSLRCKTRGIPSAKRRSEYVAAHRQRRREGDLAIAGDAIRDVPVPRQYLALKGALPSRPRKALLHLLRVARGQSHPDRRLS